MLALAGINALGLALFVGVYAGAALRWLSHGAFLAALVMLLGAVTALWVRVEGRGAGVRGPLERIGRAAIALLLVVALGPIAVLMPLFALDTQLPPEARLTHLISRTMVLLLVSIALVTLCNVGGALAQVVLALRTRLVRRGPGG
jgi:hypothetical protein